MFDYKHEKYRDKSLEQYTILTPSDVMDILNIGKNSAYALLNSGKLQGFRVGRSGRVSLDALEGFIHNR